MGKLKQSVSERMKRLRDGCCPVHGLAMCPRKTPVGSLHDARLDSPGRPRPTLVLGCVRRDCTFWCLAYTLCGPWELPAEFSHLIAPDFSNGDEPVYVEQSEGWKRAEEYLHSLSANGKVEDHRQAAGDVDPDSLADSKAV